MSATGRRQVRSHAALRIAASFALLAGLCLLLPFDQLVAALGRVPGHAWPLALGTYVAIHLVGTAKWRLLVNRSGAGLSFRAAVRCYFGGLFGNIFLPSVVGGDLVRAGLALQLSPNKGAVLFGSLVDRALDIGALGLVAGIGVLLMPHHLDANGRRLFFALAVVFAAAGIAALLAFMLLPARRFPYRWRRQLVRGRRVVVALLRAPGTVVLALAIGVGLQSSLAMLNAWLAGAAGTVTAPAIWLFVWPLAKVSAILPVSQGGIGVREAALVALFLPFGVPAVAAMAAGLVFEAVVIAGGFVAGIVSFGAGRGLPASGRPQSRATAAPLPLP